MNVLITAVSGPTAVGVIKCLRNQEGISLFGTDIYANTIGKKWLEKTFVVSQHIYADKYEKELKEIIADNHIDVIIPTLQEELPLVKRIAEEMNIHAMIVDGYDLSRLLNKKLIYEDMSALGFDQYIPKYKTYTNPCEIKDIVAESFASEKYICFKKIDGHGGKGFFQVALGKDDYIDRLDKGVVHIDDFVEFCERNNTNEEMMVSEFVQGEEISVDVLRYDHKLISVVPRVRTRVSTGIVIDGKTEERKDIIEVAGKIVEAFNLEGFVNMQFMCNDEKTVLIDLNPRFCGSQVMSFGAGVNFPKLWLDAVYGKDVEPVEPNWGIVTRRYWESVFYDDKGNII